MGHKTCWDIDFGLLPQKFGLKYAPDRSHDDDNNDRSGLAKCNKVRPHHQPTITQQTTTSPMTKTTTITTISTITTTASATARQTTLMIVHTITISRTKTQNQIVRNVN